MSTLKQSIFWTAFYLTIIVILAQFDYFEDTPVIDFAKYFYVVAILVIPTTIFLPSITKVNVFVPMIVWGGIYLVVLQTVDRTASSPNSSFAVVLLEFILVEIGAWLGYQAAFGIGHAESVMDAMALTAFPNRTQFIHEAAKQIKIEFTRSRRFHRPLGMIVLQIHIDDRVRIKELIANIQQDLWNRFSFARIGQVIDEQIRQTDMVFRERGSRFVILCPETDHDNTEVLAKRISEAIEHRTGVRVVLGAAGFPNDAINFDDLLDVANSRLVQSVRGENILPKVESSEAY